MRCSIPVSARTAATPSRRVPSPRRWVTITRTATHPSTTPWSGWPSPGRCATRWSPGNDPAAAMRYTEARLTPLAMEMLREIDEETVDFIPNYDGRVQEPTVLPSRFPNLLANGSGGIAVGMATNIPPHNLGELAEAVYWCLENHEADEEATLTAVCERVKGPDFPTSGLIVGAQGITDT